MRGDGAWDRDPVPDPMLRRLAAATVGPAAAAAGRLRLEIGDHERGAPRCRPLGCACMVGGRGPLGAAGGRGRLAAVLVSGLVLFGSPVSASSTPEAAPETAAVAQIIDRYPGDAVLASLISGDESDALSPWSEP